jgi:hypothetical protein
MKAPEFAQPIKMREPTCFEGKPEDDFETWWILLQINIKDELEKFPKDRRTMDWIGSLMDRYAAAWHIQWLKRMWNGAYLISIIGYINARLLRFEIWDTSDGAYLNLEIVRYDGDLGNIITNSQMCTIRHWSPVLR